MQQEAKRAEEDDDDVEEEEEEEEEDQREHWQVALHEYASRLPDELSVSKGDAVEVFATFDDGWGRGRNARSGEVGVFPLQVFV
ncbi:hypothetical protein DFJ73DRAFT_819873 [Zopfochytrium polystomum]|nr:hypothetical protein DFJ73DRAFT_819873 [Zopfochytrium polystomum]